MEYIFYADRAKSVNVRWKLDSDESLPYAVIEDTEDGLSVIEFPTRDEGFRVLAEHVINLHNSFLDGQKDAYAGE